MPSTSARFSIAGALGIIGLFGIGFAALATPSAFWMNTVFTLNLAVLVAALIGWLFRRDPARRAFWAGVLIAGGSYLFLSRTTWLGNQGFGEPLATTMLLDILYAQIEPPPTTVAPASGMMMGMMGGGGMSGMGSMMSGSGMMAGGATGPPSPPPTRWSRWNVPDRSNEAAYINNLPLVQGPRSFFRIGHSLFSLLFGIMGGLLAQRYRRGNEVPIREYPPG